MLLMLLKIKGNYASLEEIQKNAKNSAILDV
jgi:hypothetical protein